MTSRSQRVIRDAIRDYKRVNLAKAKGFSEVATDMNQGWAQKRFEECMATDDAVELAMQEIVVTQ